MAVSIEELSCLDCTIWLKSQSKASDFLRISQPVASRNIKKYQTRLILAISKTTENIK